MPLADYQRLLQDAQGYVLISLQDLTGDSVDQYLKRCLEDNADPLALLERAALRQALAESIQLLPRKSQILLTLYYERECACTRSPNTSASRRRASRKCTPSPSPSYAPRWPTVTLSACSPAHAAARRA